MPVYEDRNQDCGAMPEKLVRSMDDREPERLCPECGGWKVEKLLTAFAIRISSSASEPVCPTCEAPGR